MKKIVLSFLTAVLFLSAHSQITDISLQASGLTCSMCSKAVLNALKEVQGVSEVKVNIKNQEYLVRYKDDAAPDPDALARAVSDAGFSVARLSVKAVLPNTELKKDMHLKIGNLSFHFLNASGQSLSDSATFVLVDRNFTSPKTFKKYSAMSKMKCVETGKWSSCCSKDGTGEERIYHAII